MSEKAVKPLKILGVGSAGFPVPASAGDSYGIGDDSSDGINITEFVVRDRDASYMIKAKTTSLKSLGVNVGDILILERGLDPKSGDIVLAVDDEGTAQLKIFVTSAGTGTATSTIDQTSRIDGVVVSLIRKYR